ncbi:MAG: esterase/lipase [Planctomycetota bacterium]|nr:esterase/lipase [Planctomycetota bacterium]
MPRPIPIILGFLLFAGSVARADDGVIKVVVKLAPVYPHKSITAQSFGAGARSYWIFEPAGPTPEKAAVVVFHHGWLAVNPGVYGAWIEHLVRSGKVVIFPKYQTDFITRPADFLPNAVFAVRDALDVLETGPGRVRPDRDRFAIIGHSAGGNLSAQMAAIARESGLPEPKAVICVCPGEVRPLREPDLSRIPSTTLLTIAATDGDRLVGDCRAREIYGMATSIPISRKKYILYRSDRRGRIPIIADHLAPTAGLATLDSGEGLFRARQMNLATLDILDRFGFWRMTDLTIAAGFAGQTLDEATSNGALFRDLGRWSDGQPVTPPLCGDDLDIIPRTIAANGGRFLPWSVDEFRRMMMAEKP